MSFQCVPTCISCEQAGKCDKVWERVAIGISQRSHRMSRTERAARNAAIERQIGGYIHANCGHLTTIEAQDFFAAWRPHIKAIWCETCHEWVSPLSKPPRLPIPEEPLF